MVHVMIHDHKMIVVTYSRVGTGILPGQEGNNVQ